MEYTLYQSINKGNYLYSPFKNQIVKIPKNIFLALSKDPNGYELKNNKLYDMGYLNVIDYFRVFNTTYNKNDICNFVKKTKHFLININNSCNLNCKYCIDTGYIYNRESKKAEDIQTEGIINFLNFFINQNEIGKNTEFIVGFFGGEPLLKISEIKEIVKYLKQKSDTKFQFYITTNGTLFFENIKFLIDNEFTVNVSIDGNKRCNAYRVDKLGNNSFEIVNKNLINVKKYSIEYFNKYVHIQSVIHDMNINVNINRYFEKKFNKSTTLTEIKREYNLKNNKKFNKMFRPYFHFINNRYSTEKEFIINTASKFNIERFFITLEKKDNINKEDVSIRNSINYMPTGTCSPFGEKVYLDNGVVYTCEKNNNNKLGKIENGGVFIDYEKIAIEYNEKYKNISLECSTCYQFHKCNKCFFLNFNEKNKCISHLNKEEFKQMLINYTEEIENNAELFRKYAEYILEYKHI